MKKFRRAPCQDCGQMVATRISDGGRFPHTRCVGGKYFPGDTDATLDKRRAIVQWALSELNRRQGAGGYAKGQRYMLHMLLKKLGEPTDFDAVDPVLSDSRSPSTRDAKS